jgi:hypothetical protein
MLLDVVERLLRDIARGFVEFTTFGNDWRKRQVAIGERGNRKKGRLCFLVSHDENRGSSPLGSANDFNKL